jgi:hypothetical protein
MADITALLPVLANVWLGASVENADHLARIDEDGQFVRGGYVRMAPSSGKDHPIGLVATRLPDRATLERDDFSSNRHLALSFCLSMISAQTRSAFVARENRYPLFRIVLEQASIDTGLGSLDRHGADHLRIEGGGPNAADDGIAKALLPHVFKAGEQQGCTYSAISRARFDAGGPEEVRTGGVMAGKSQDVAFPDHDETGNRLAAERDFDFARPCLAEGLPYPSGHLVLLGRESAAHDVSRLPQPFKRLARIGKIVKLHLATNSLGMATILCSRMLLPLSRDRTNNRDRAAQIR